jgi:hypothetical protein
MKNLWPVLACACACCGGSAGTGLGIEIQGLSASDIGAIQITVLSHGNLYGCDKLTSTCLSAQVADAEGNVTNTDVVVQKDSSGKDTHSLRVPLTDASALTGSGLTVDLTLGSGTNFLVIAEVLAKDDGVNGQLPVLASGCVPVSELDDGDNKPLNVTAVAKATPPPCDGRINP